MNDSKAAGANGKSGVKDRPLLVGVIFLFFLLFPKLPFVPFSVVGVAIQAAILTIVTTALVMLTGWVGQISLGHAALVGLGAYSTGWAMASWDLHFPFSVLAAGLVAALVAAILGGVALRVRGLYLAVATLIFSWMADAFLFRIGGLIKHSQIQISVIGDPSGVPRFDLNDRTTMYYVAWGVALMVMFMAANVRDSRTGRAFFAVKGSEVGAASIGIDVTRYKLLAFTFSGFLAGVAGSLIMIDARSLSSDSFLFTKSLFYLSVAVVGGLVSLGGGLASSLVFAGLDEVFFRVRALGDQLDLVSALLLTIVLLMYRGGMAAIPGAVRSTATRLWITVSSREPSWLRWFRSWFPSRLGREISALRQQLAHYSARIPFLRSKRAKALAYELKRPVLLDRSGRRVSLESLGTPSSDPAAQQTANVLVDEDLSQLQVVLPPRREERTPLIVADRITVQFGGLIAVDDASLTVREHEIVGLIGPNGAGKSTLFNAIAGLNSPAKGSVQILGTEATSLPVHERAKLGVARTFQAIQLFPQLDVFNNLLVATHIHNMTGFFRHLFAVDSYFKAEVEARQRVHQVIEELGLHDVAYRRAMDLPFGVLRMVEVARAMVTGFPLIMLDEPASGLDNRETDRLSQMLLDIRTRGVTLLLIEHDVKMVTGVSDYMYVLVRGSIIAEGLPADIQRDPQVMAAYLGEAPPDSGAARTPLAQEVMQAPS